MDDSILNPSLERVINAFNEDGFRVNRDTGVKQFLKGFGIRAEHKTAQNYDTASPKFTLYLEGDSYEMGYLLGQLAEPEISRMATEFVDEIVLSFIGETKRKSLLGEIIAGIVYELSKVMHPDLPREFKLEMEGIIDGCQEVNPKSPVTMERLQVLNYGVDILLSLVYTGDFLLKRIPDMKPQELRIPVFCNAFCIFGKAADRNFFFGRDFMFHTAGVFQDTACMIIYNYKQEDNKTIQPIVSMTAPGMVGSVTGLNSSGVGIGVDMAPAGNCNPAGIGLNSLLLNRYTVQYGTSAHKAVDIMVRSTRGVTWNYIVGDGMYNQANVLETGASQFSLNPLQYPPKELIDEGLLPTHEFLKEHPSTTYKSGIMQRNNEYKYPEEYLQFNEKLWKNYNEKFRENIKLYDDAFSERGYINKTYSEENCPGVFYFAPIREKREDVVLATNHFIIPEMRLCAMLPWTSVIVGKKINDIQWRYDELNNRILTAVDREPVTYDKAKELLDFLRPDGDFPEYYKNNPRSRDGKEIQIQGSQSLLDLKKKTIESHYGYYCDEWVKISLMKYV